MTKRLIENLLSNGFEKVADKTYSNGGYVVIHLHDEDDNIALNHSAAVVMTTNQYDEYKTDYDQKEHRCLDSLYSDIVDHHRSEVLYRDDLNIHDILSYIEYN